MILRVKEDEGTRTTEGFDFFASKYGLWRLGHHGTYVARNPT